MLISVVIPCYNSAETLEACLNSLFDQTYRDIEIICIDDGSTDDTKNKLTSFKKTSPFPFYIINQEKHGANFARNKGLDVSNGDYIQFMDSDDYLLPTKVESQVQLISTNPNIDLIIAPYESRNSKAKHIFEVNATDYWLALIVGRAGFTSSNLFRKQIINDVGGWDVSLKSSQETELLFRIFQKSDRICFSEKVETIKNQRSAGSISSEDKAANWERAIQLRIDIWDYLKRNNLLTIEREIGSKQIIFDCIRTLYYVDSRKALQLYKKHIKGKYKPVKSIATSSLFISLNNILGFGLTQRLFSFLRK